VSGVDLGIMGVFCWQEREHHLCFSLLMYIGSDDDNQNDHENI